MISQTSKVFTSDKDYEYGEVEIQKLLEKKDNYFPLSLNSKSNTYSFVPIEDIESKKYDGKVFNMIFENNIGRRYDLTVSEDCEFITNRGFVPVKKLHEHHVCFDFENRKCKMISKTEVENDNIMYDLSVSYTYNYFCDGILIKGRI